jgi:glucose-6-phosphate isomerase
VIKNNLLIKNNIQSKYLKKKQIVKFSKKYNELLINIKEDIENSSKTLNVLSKNFRFTFKIKDLKKFKKYQTIAIIGMGGSILGSEAIFAFLKRKIKKKIYFFDDINQEKIFNFKKKINYKDVLFFIISKSGNTIETLSNTLFLKILKKNSKNIIVISEKKNNTLLTLTKKLNLFYIEHKKHIGGRYSVLSEAGLVPAHLMGINVLKLRSNILFLQKKKYKNYLKDSCIKLASLMNSKKLNNLILVNYSPDLEKFLYWCQQLIAESLGKKKMGFLPLISNNPKDHHSLLQLYIDGPRDKIFNIFSLEKKSKEKLKSRKNLKMKNFLNNKDFKSIKGAQQKALIKTFKKHKIPFREFKIKSQNEEVLGKLFSYFMLETVMIGKLLKINPFDQPAVEQVKTYTKNFLT